MRGSKLATTWNIVRMSLSKNPDILALTIIDIWRSLAEVEEPLLSLALLKKSPLSQELSVHRLVQSEFCYYVTDEERQTMFDNATKLLYDAFPKQFNGRLMHSEWNTCSLYVQHVLSLARNFRTRNRDLASLHPTAEFCKLLCSCIW